MQRKKNKELWTGLGLLLGFILWTALIRFVDVQAAGPDGSKVGFAAFNLWFHQLTGVHMGLYTLTDWLGLVPISVCLGFGVLGLLQWVRRKSPFRVDPDLLLLGGYYLLVILAYLFFEMAPVNYRPVLIDGVLEASYPSSTTLLIASVMPTLKFEADRRVRRPLWRHAVNLVTLLFSAFMVIGRLIAGVHWATDIIGALLLSAGLFRLFRYLVHLTDRPREDTHGIQ